MEIGVHKMCHECQGIMILDIVQDYPDPCNDLIWECTWCGINELYDEFLLRIKQNRRFY